MPALRLRRLPERTPIRLTIGVAPELHRALADYAAIYAEAYGEEESVADLVPFMLEAFLEGDRDFARARRARAQQGRNTPSA
jgi:hypothetical protein